MMGVGGYRCRNSKPFASICTMYAAYVTQPHTHTHTHTYDGVTQLEVSIPHGECFLALALNCNPWNCVPLIP